VMRHADVDEVCSLSGINAVYSCCGAMAQERVRTCSQQRRCPARALVEIPSNLDVDTLVSTT